jgi:heme-degrading monooxygenase HmoA
MIVRIWRTEIERARMSEYEQFAQERSLPMFHQQQGFLAVLFLGTQKDRAVLSLWKDLSCVEALAQSSTYQETAAQLNATGLLVGQTSVEVFEAQGGTLELEALAHLLRAAQRDPVGDQIPPPKNEKRGPRDGAQT